MAERSVYLLREIKGEKIRAGRHCGAANGRLYFDWNENLYSLDLGALRGRSASLDKARKENFPDGQILGIMANGRDALAVVRAGVGAKLLTLADGEWKTIASLPVAWPLASAAFGSGFVFCETNPAKETIVYQWTPEKGLKTLASFAEPMKIFSISAEDGKLRLVVSGKPSKILEADSTKEGELTSADFASRELPFMAFKEISAPGKRALYSEDGASRIYAADGGKVWEDAAPGECGYQLAASASLDGRLGIVGSWRRDAAHPSACLYVFDGERVIYKRAVKSAEPEKTRWTGYETNHRGPGGCDLYIPCYGGGIMNIRRADRGADTIGATILAEGKDYTLLGRFEDARADAARGHESVVLYANPARDLGAVWRAQNHFPDCSVTKADVYLTFDVEQHLHGKPYCITGGDLPGASGIYGIMDALEANGLFGTFFVNIYEFENFEPGFMEKLLRDIDSRGHEVGLHCHISMKANTALTFNKRPLGELNRDQQARILEFGAEYIRGVIGEYPVSFRSGGYNINNATLDALEKLGFAVDSSVFFSQMESQHNLAYLSKNKPARYGKLLEMPVTSLKWDGRPSKLDINWLYSSRALMAALDACREAGLDQLVTMAHSFSFLKFTTNPKDKAVDFQFTGNRFISGINSSLFKEYALFLKNLSRAPEYRVRLLREAASLEPAPAKPDAVPEYFSLEKNAKICPICGYKGEFHPYRGRPGAQCPGCGCLERMRLKNIYLKKSLKVLDGRAISILHAGPHLVTSAWLKSLPNIEYVSTDPYNDADCHFPLEKIPFADATFDLTIAIAVFNHLLDDDQAFKEINRVLKPGGELLLWVGGLENERTKEQYNRENFSKMIAHDFSRPLNVANGKITEKDGKLYYNPNYGTRVYGRDILDKLRGLGFEATVVEAVSIVNDPEKYGIPSNDKLISCKKIVI